MSYFRSFFTNELWEAVGSTFGALFFMKRNSDTFWDSVELEPDEKVEPDGS